MYGDTNQFHCKDDLMQNTLDLINRQKSEIEENNLKIDHQAQIIRTLETALDNKMAEIEKMKSLLKSGGEYINCLEKEMTEKTNIENNLNGGEVWW